MSTLVCTSFGDYLTNSQQQVLLSKQTRNQTDFQSNRSVLFNFKIIIIQTTLGLSIKKLLLIFIN